MSKQPNAMPAKSEDTIEPELDLKSIERRVNRFCRQDGLDDIAAGAMLLWIGMIYAFVAAPVVGMALLIGILFLSRPEFWRPRLTYPRIGYTALISMRRRFGLKLSIPVYIGLMLMWLLIWKYPAIYVATLENWLGWLIVCIVLILMGLHYSVVRWYCYAGIVAVFAGLSHVWGLDWFAAMTYSGALILVCGLVVLLKFIRQHPVLNGDKAGEADCGNSGGGGR